MLAVVPQMHDMIDVGSVLMLVGEHRGRSRRRRRPVARTGPVAEPTVKAAQLLAKYGLQASEVPRAARASASRTSKTTSRRRGQREASAETAGRRDDAPGPPGVGAGGAGDVEALTPEERGMLRTVLWQRDEAVPGYVELVDDAAAWDRIAADYQQQERLLLNPLLALMAYRLVAGREGEPAADVHDRRRGAFRLRSVNLGFTVQSETTLYLAVVENAQDMTAREFIDRLSSCSGSALAHRLRAHEASGATISFSSMARWNVKRHIPVLPPQTALIVAHASRMPTAAACWGPPTITGC